MKRNAALALMLLMTPIIVTVIQLMRSISANIPWKIIASVIALSIFLFLWIAVFRQLRKKH